MEEAGGDGGGAGFEEALRLVADVAVVEVGGGEDEFSGGEDGAGFRAGGAGGGV